jgi:hypothetical protein
VIDREIEDRTLPPRKIELWAVAPHYRAWIAEHYPTREKALWRCGDATEKMIEAFPELKRVRGYYDATEHWWCEAPDGTIIDPTYLQFGDLCTGEYRALDETKPQPTGYCPFCGGFTWGDKSLCGSDECKEEAEAQWR